MHSVKVNPATYLTSDPRFKSWVKVIASEADINLRLSGGFALTTKIQPFDKVYTLFQNQFLLLAVQHGTRSKQKYEHVLLHLDDNGDFHEVAKGDLLLAYVEDENRDDDNAYYYAVAQYCQEVFEDASAHRVKPETVDANAVGLTHIATRVLIDELDSRISRDDCDIVSYLAGMIENLSDRQLIEFVVNRGYAIVNENGEAEDIDPFE